MTAAVEIDLFSPEFFADPYPLYRKLREEAPVFWAAKYGIWILTRYRDVLAILHDDRFTRSLKASAGFSAIYNGLPDSPIKRDFDTSISQVDSPEHDRLRTIVRGAFTRAVAERFRPDVQTFANRFIARLERDGSADLHRDVSLSMPVRLLARFFGIPSDQEDRLTELAWESMRATHPLATAAERQRAMEAVHEIEDLVRSLLSQPSRLAGSLLAHVHADLTEVEIQSLIRSLIVAGAEPPGNLIDLGVMTLYRHPDQLEIVRKCPALVPSAISEILRFNHVGRFVQRIARRDVEIDGHHVSRGTMVLAGIAAAHRDPEAFPEPDVFDVRRQSTKAFPFGFGRFACIANHLARAQAEEFLASLVTRVPRLRFSDDDIEWDSNLFLRKMKRFVVRV